MSEQRDKNVTSVIDQLRNREKAGLNKYGTNTERTDLDTLEWLQHLQEELMDGAVYIERLKGDVKELLRLSSEPEGREEQPEWHPGHEPQVAGHGDIHEDWPLVSGEEYDNYDAEESKWVGARDKWQKENPIGYRFATDKEAGFVDDTTGLKLHEVRETNIKHSTPEHIKIPTDD